MRLRGYLRESRGFVLAIFTMVLAMPLWAGPQNKSIVEGIDPSDRARLQDFSSLSVRNLRAVNRLATPASVRARTEEVYALGNRSIGGRPLDDEGRAPVHRYVQDQLDRLAPHGVEYLGSLREIAFAPVRLDRLPAEENPGPRAAIAVGDQVWPVEPFWPNGAMPSLVPEEGLRGPLVYVGQATWEDLNDRNLEGAIALMDFAGGRQFERLFALGARAVVVLADGFVLYEKARELGTMTPFPFPRFYADAETAAALKAQAAAGATARLQGGHVWTARPVESLFAWLPSTGPLEVAITDELLLDLVAADYGLSAQDLVRYNNLESPRLEVGQELRIPGTARRYTVRPNDLRDRLISYYFTPLEDLRVANGWEGEIPALVPGDIVTIPPAERPLVLTVPLDTVSMVPDAPHGGRQALNLAAALTALEYLATSDNVVRRRDVLVIFLDGDTLGGIGSRFFAEALELSRGGLQAGVAELEASQLERYRAARAWFAGEVGTIPDRIAAWLEEDWLASQFEDVRTRLAEERVPFVIALNDATDPAEITRLREEVDRVEAELQFVVDLRDDTLNDRSVPLEVRLGRLYERLQEPEVAARLKRWRLDLDSLRTRFMREFRQEEEFRRNEENNQRVVADIAQRIEGDTVVGGPEMTLGWYFDLGDATPHVGVSAPGTASNADLRNSSVAGAQATAIGNRMRDIIGFAAETAGWERDYLFVTESDRATFPSVDTMRPALYDDFWVNAGLMVLPFVAVNDPLERIDTPRDTLDGFNWDNAATQLRTALTLVGVTVESTGDSVAKRVKVPEYSRAIGRSVQFNIRSGIDAREPVPGTTMIYPGSKSDGGWDTLNADVHRGYRRAVVRQTLLNGSYRIPLEVTSYWPQPKVFAYRLDRERALFSNVANEGQVGTAAQDSEFRWLPGGNVEHNLVMSEVYPLVIFPGSDPFQYNPIGGSGRATVRLTVIDAVIDGAPQDYAVDNPIRDYREKDIAAMTVYGEVGRRLRIISQSGVRYRMLLVGEVEGFKGKGHRVGPTDDGDPNVYLTHTPVHVAEEMLALARNRLEVYREYGITSRPLDEALDRATVKYGQAVSAMEDEDWQESIGRAREAWGIVIKNYPRILGLGREAVFSVILLMAFLVPASYFLERLVVGSKGIVGRLAGTTFIFTLGTIFLNFFHPAFQIALSPFIVVIAFTMILMSVIVLGICYQRFEVLLRRARSSGGEVESEEIGLIASLGTAFGLGVSNLKKRLSRTALTTVTVTALTFSIVAFVAVTGRDAVQREVIPLDPIVGDQRVDPLAPAYEGVLFRKFQWQDQGANRLDAVRTEFGSDFDIVLRAHYLETEGGNQAAREGVNQVPVRRGERVVVLTGIMCFEPEERDFSGLNDAVSNDAWFQGEREVDGELLAPDRFTVILPDHAARDLGITAEMIFDAAGERRPDAELPTVLMRNRTWKVVGILAVDHANRIRDINGKSLAMVDYLRSGFSANVGGNLEEEGTTYHQDWAEFAIVPLEAYQDIDAKLRAAAVKFPPGTDIAAFFQDVAIRLNEPMFAHVGGESFFVTTRQTTNLAGLAKILLPVILCILIVMNTMLGTVEERRGEVSMLGAVGLSPRQIAFLLLSEATVFSILGMVLGTFGGLLFANVVGVLNASGIAFLPNLSFNFTSLVSMILATGTGLIVLVATLIPARKAAALAAPSGMAQWTLPDPDEDGRIRFELPFTLTRGNAVGMAAFFRRFLLNHTEVTSRDFHARHIDVQLFDDAGGAGLEAVAHLFLTPYDLDVAQQFALRIFPGKTEGVFAARIVLERTSGAEEAWLRTNYNFLNLVRQQFLLWRNLSPEIRARYIEEGRELLANANAVQPAPSSA